MLKKELPAAKRKLLKETINHAFTDGGDPAKCAESW
jgi:hypothetical protein